MSHFKKTLCRSLLAATLMTTVITQHSGLSAYAADIATQAKKSDKEITLKKIMSNPDWIGIQPTRWGWSYDSQNILYQQKRKGDVISDRYMDGLGAHDAPKLIGPKDHYQHYNDRVVYNQAKDKTAFIFKGNLFIRDLSSGAVTQLTRSSDRISQPLFLTDGRLSYRTGNRFMAMDVNTGMTIELAHVKKGDMPKVMPEGPKSYVAKEQHKLIKYIQKGHDERTSRAKHSEKLKTQDPTLTPDAFYTGKGFTPRTLRLSPDGSKLFVMAEAKRPQSGKKDIMPDYIRPDASIKAHRARLRVGSFEFAQQKYMLIDLKSRDMKTLSIKDLDGFDEDVLADVRRENHKRDGKKYKSKKQPRKTALWGASWTRDGKQLALMLRARDNKDRWIATVDLNKGKMIQRERLHDDAWVNIYAFNQMGWADDNKTLYFQSERDGYGHIYTVDVTKKSKLRALTKGNYIVENLRPSPDGNHLYFTANKTHPGTFDVYRADLKSREHEQMTTLGGKVDYRISPNGKKLLVQQSETTRPPELFVQDAAVGAKATQISQFTSKEFLSFNWQVPEVVEVPSTTHGRPIYARVYRPDSQHTDDKKRGVMFIHGAGYLHNAHKGWSGYFREFMFHQMLAQKGYVVMDMDWRASKGYGRDWRTAIYRHMGKPEVEDIKDGVSFMVKNENVDPNRVGGYGGSYGGFLTLMTMFTEPDLFAAGSALRLVSDWTSYNHGYTSNILNTPKDDPIAFERSSPIYFAEGLKKPLLLNAPMVDSNVFFQDTVRLVQRLIELEKTDHFETAIFPVENHGFTEPSSWLDEYRRIFKLFENNL